MRYEEYLRTAEWRSKRAWALERAEHRCQVCNSDDRLQVHHRTYANLGAELPGDVIVLCDSCHELYHFQHDGPLVEQAEALIAGLSWETLNDEEGAWVERVIPIIQKVKNRSRKAALYKRVVAALDALDHRAP